MSWSFRGTAPPPTKRGNDGDEGGEAFFFAFAFDFGFGGVRGRDREPGVRDSSFAQHSRQSAVFGVRRAETALVTAY